MNENRYEPFPQLIETFFETIENEFSFLCTEFKYRESTRLIDYGEREKEYQPEKFPKSCWIFMAKKKYEDKNGFFIISYGDRESIVEIRYQSKKNKLTFGVWELFKAKGLNYDDISGNQFVLNSKFMEKTIKRISIELKQYLNEIIPVKKDTIKVIEENRKELQEKYDNENKMRGIEICVSNASKEFQKHNYEKVVEMLSEFENDLSEAQKMKLIYARKKVNLV